MEDDRRLLDFETYEDYLDSFLTKEDLCYLRSLILARTISELGYRSTSETLSKRQFEERKSTIHEILFPSRKPHILACDGAELSDPFLRELADRERPNRVGILSVRKTVYFKLLKKHLCFIYQKKKIPYE